MSRLSLRSDVSSLLVEALSWSRITPKGLTVDADPRHTELLAQSLGLTDSNAVATPGVKDPEAEYALDKRNEIAPVTNLSQPGGPPLEGERRIAFDQPIASLKTSLSNNAKHVRFNVQATSTLDVTPYSQIYGVHPSRLKATAEGMKIVQEHVDPYTSKKGEIMRARSLSMRKGMLLSTCPDAHEYRLHIMQKMISGQVPTTPSQIQNGQIAIPAGASAGVFVKQPAHGVLEPELAATLGRLYATRTPPAFKKGGPGAKRQGAKAVKKLERLSSNSFVLPPEEATMFRALSARANFLSQDRPDINFATKELCREFAHHRPSDHVEAEVE